MFNLAKFSPQEVFPLLKNRIFLKLWGAQILGQTGINALHFILVLEVFEKTGNNFVVGILIAVLSLPAIFVSPIAGVLADSFNRRDLLMLINLSRLLFVIGIILAFKLPGLLIVFAFLVTTSSMFLMPTEQASIPDIVPSAKVLQANSFFSFSLYGSFLIGYAGAGPLLEHGGDFISLAVIGGLFLLAALLDRSLPSLGQHVANQQASISERLQLKIICQQLLEGARYIFHNKVLLGIIVQVSFIFAVERAVIALIPDLAQNILKFSISEISFFMITPLALGTVGGVLLINRFKYSQPLPKLIIIGLLIDALALILFPLYEDLTGFIHQISGLVITDGFLLRLYIMVIAIASGLADVMIIVSAQTFIHRNVGSAIRGRVFASLMTLMNLLGVPLVLIISFLADLINILATLVGFGLATLLIAGWSWHKYKKMTPQTEISATAD